MGISAWKLCLISYVTFEVQFELELRGEGNTPVVNGPSRLGLAAECNSPGAMFTFFLSVLFVPYCISGFLRVCMKMNICLSAGDCELLLKSDCISVLHTKAISNKAPPILQGARGICICVWLGYFFLLILSYTEYLNSNGISKRYILSSQWLQLLSLPGSGVEKADSSPTDNRYSSGNTNTCAHPIEL